MLFTYSAKLEVCAGLAIALCIGVGGLIAASATLASAVAVGHGLLQRIRIQYAGSLIALSYFSWSLLSICLYRWLPVNSLFFLAISAALFVSSFIFYDWYLSSFRAPKSRKVWIIILAAVACLLLATVGHDRVGVASATRASEIRAALAESGMTFLVPPPNSSYPQPYSIAPQSTRDGHTDYRVGAYFSIDTGKHNGTTLYEYKYPDGTDPILDCRRISSLLISEWSDQKVCRLVTTLPSGTNIYASPGGSPLFVIKNGIVAIYSPPDTMNDQEAYEFLDHLVPLEINSFLKTLHQKNPMNY